jgi:hypothetical protein
MICLIIAITYKNKEWFYIIGFRIENKTIVKDNKLL